MSLCFLVFLHGSSSKGCNRVSVRPVTRDSLLLIGAVRGRNGSEGRTSLRLPILNLSMGLAQTPRGTNSSDSTLKPLRFHLNVPSHGLSSLDVSPLPSRDVSQEGFGSTPAYSCTDTPSRDADPIVGPSLLALFGTSSVSRSSSHTRVVGNTLLECWTSWDPPSNPPITESTPILLSARLRRNVSDVRDFPGLRRVCWEDTGYCFESMTSLLFYGSWTAKYEQGSRRGGECGVSTEEVSE